MTEEYGLARIPLKREGGAYGSIEITYSVHNLTARPEVDYVVGSNKVVMADGSRNATIDITIRDDSEMEFEEIFEVHLLTASGIKYVSLLSNSCDKILIHLDMNSLTFFKKKKYAVIWTMKLFFLRKKICCHMDDKTYGQS